MITLTPPFPAAPGTGSEPAAAAPEADPGQRPNLLPHRIVAIGGGKGGIGKSILAVSLAVELARRALRVVLVDCDLGGANLHSLLGIDQPVSSLSDFVLRRAGSLAELQVPTTVPLLSLISGARNAIQLANPLYQQKVRLLRALRKLDADVLVLDLGAGTHYNVVDFFLLAHHGILVVMPEPTSVENAYRFLKAAFLRWLKALDAQHEIKEIVQDVARAEALATLTPAELVSAVSRRDPAVGATLARELATFKPLLVVNQVRDTRDLALGEGMNIASRRLLGIELGYLGHVRYYDQLWRAVRAHRPLFSDQLGRPFAADLAAIGARLLACARAEEPA
jgi:flagellar biosynthesis protein FlhG